MELRIEKTTTQAPQASFVRAMMTPPNLPRKPRGWPNILLKTLRIMLIDRGPSKAAVSCGSRVLIGDRPAGVIWRSYVMIPEIDIWRAANLMLKRYGERALEESGAGRRARRRRRRQRRTDLAPDHRRDRAARKHNTVRPGPLTGRAGGWVARVPTGRIGDFRGIAGLGVILVHRLGQSLLQAGGGEHHDFGRACM